MTFHYYAIFNREEPGKPLGLMAVNHDDGRLDMILFNRTSNTWEAGPGAVAQVLFGDDYIDERAEVPRSRAEEIAPTLGTAVPSEDEMMRINDEAVERRRRATALGAKEPLRRVGLVTAAVRAQAATRFQPVAAPAG